MRVAMPMVGRLGALGSVALVALALLLSSGAPVGAANPLADYIVTLRPSVADVDGTASDLARTHGGRPGFVYRHALRGFSISLPPPAAAALSRDPRVVAVEPDGVASIVDTESPTPSWGLDRIDQRLLPLNTSYTFDAAASGNGVTAYIIDTGVLKTHTDFGGRAVDGWDFVGNDGDADDCNGHGTHVAGTVGGTSYGVAKGVTLVAVRVLNCAGSGSWSGVIAGIDWVTADHAARGTPAVANMSLGGSASASLDSAVANSIAHGVVYAVAAGNSNVNACTASPARTAAALTVGATTSTDGEASFSNYGSCVDLLAPGVSITSAWKNGGSNTISGTSMASPHVAGAAVLYLASHAGATPGDVDSGLKTAATQGRVALKGASAAAGTPNQLLFVGASTTTTGTVAGTVRDANGVAIANAQLAVDTGQGAITGPTGAYSIGGVPTGTRAVTASASGFVSSTVSVALDTAGATAVADFVLVAQPTATATSVSSVACRLSGGRDGTKDLLVAVTLLDSLNQPVSNASVTLQIVRTAGGSWSPTSTTGANGTASFKLGNAAAGTYTAEVTNVNATPTWDGVHRSCAITK